MELKNSHGGFQGKCIAEKIEVELDQWYLDYINYDITPDYVEADKSRWFGRVEGMCEALGVLRSSSMAQELLLVHERYEATKNAADGVIGA